ncbi:FxsA family protein [Zophobihabitans entericus]|uniref:FxsA family protein n=1 Tax=Zophobihabitans entericus TaxID=1635327 RepID=A0A6G9I8J6_9GAMM|nr:FxsA family protein [Zophobihabitans entericus]QIQ20535.1 FxsA family protein [Zophobihabitans entericus]
MLAWLPLVILFIYAYVEINVFIAVADVTGVFFALICIIATSIIGLSLVASQGIKNFMQMQQKMQMGENATPELMRSVSLLFAGFFLLIPGFITDLIGIFLLLPPTRALMSKYVMPRFSVSTRFYSSGSAYQRPSNNQQDVIEGEFSRKDDE